MNILTDVIPPAGRKYVYALVALASLVWAAYEASSGDWTAFIGGLIVSLSSAMAGSNVTPGYTGQHTDE